MLYISKKAKNVNRDRFNRREVRKTKPIEKKEVVVEPTVVENIVESDKVEPQVVFVEKKTKTKKGGEKNNKENDGENGRE